MWFSLQAWMICFCATMNVIVENALFKEMAGHLATCKSVNQVCFARKDQRKFVKGINVITSEECISQHRPLV